MLRPYDVCLNLAKRLRPLTFDTWCESLFCFALLRNFIDKPALNIVESCRPEVGTAGVLCWLDGATQATAQRRPNTKI